MAKGYFCNNIKKLIRKRGYKLGDFSTIHLKMSYQTFGHQLKNNNLKIETIEKILKILDVTFEEVQKSNVYEVANVINHVEKLDTYFIIEPIVKKSYKGLNGLL